MNLTGVCAVRLAAGELNVGPPLRTLGLRLLVLLSLGPRVGLGSVPYLSTHLPSQLDFPAALR